MNPTSNFGTLVGGALCLDFVNTVKGRVGTGRRGRDHADRIVGERLPSFAALVRWASLAGIADAGTAGILDRGGDARPREAAAVLRRAIRLREAMYRVFKSSIERWPAPQEDLDILNDEIQLARVHERLVLSPRPGWRWDEAQALDRVLWPVARSAADLLTSPGLQRVGQCPGEECGWLFIDTSRSGRRHWCDMATCGTLAKVRRYRRRHAAARSTSSTRPR